MPYFRIKREEAILALVFQTSLDNKGPGKRTPLPAAAHALRENLIDIGRALKAPRLPAPLVHGHESALPASTDFAYAAGFMDAEGTVNINRVDCSWRLKVQVSNTNQEVIEWFERQFGGHVCRAFRPAGRRPLWTWVKCGTKAAEFLKAIQPYLVVKREEAVLGLRLQESVEATKGRPIGQGLTAMQLHERAELSKQIRVFRSAPKEMLA